MANTKRAFRYGEDWKKAAELASPNYSPFPALQVPALEGFLQGGLKRGSIAEIHGVRSCGKTALACHILAQATAQGEVCAIVDLQDSFDPVHAAEAGVQLHSVVWVRCGGRSEYALRSADLLLHAGGFGVVLLDLSEASPQALNKIPFSAWHRFRRVLENTSTILLVCGTTPQAKSCAMQSLETRVQEPVWAGAEKFLLLKGLHSRLTTGKVAAIRPQTVFFQAIV